MSADIFISYRRGGTDSWVARRLYDSLNESFVTYLDTDSISAGDDFRGQIEDVLKSCRVVFVVIGPDWTSEEGIRRLNEPDDWVRQELAIALSQHDLRVVPLFVGRVTPPNASSLPADVRPLMARNGRAIDPDDWEAEVGQLISRLSEWLPSARRTPESDETTASTPPVPTRLRRLALPLAGAAAALGVVWMVIGRGTGGEAVVAARSVTFGGAAEAHLPNDTTHGFVTFAPGTFVFAAGVDDWRKPPESRLPAGQNITLGDLLVAKYEVTVAQYRQCATEGACRPTDPRAVDGPDEWPVRHVSWVEATQYCAWLEQKLASIDPAFVNRFGAGLHVTLPSEPEWERAAGDRGVEGYPWKGPLSPARANYAASGRLSPVPVGEFTAGATAEGIHDLSGNVAEWTRSEFRQYPYDAADGREEPNPRVTTRVVRGGSFYDAETLLRVTARQAADPARGYESVGFRVVITRVQSGAGGQSQSAPPAAAR